MPIIPTITSEMRAKFRDILEKASYATSADKDKGKYFKESGISLGLPNTDFFTRPEGMGRDFDLGRDVVVGGIIEGFSIGGLFPRGGGDYRDDLVKTAVMNEILPMLTPKDREAYTAMMKEALTLQKQYDVMERKQDLTPGQKEDMKQLKNKLEDIRTKTPTLSTLIKDKEKLHELSVKVAIIRELTDAKNYVEFVGASAGSSLEALGYTNADGTMSSPNQFNLTANDPRQAITVTSDGKKDVSVAVEGVTFTGRKADIDASLKAYINPVDSGGWDLTFEGKKPEAKTMAFTASGEKETKGIMLCAEGQMLDLRQCLGTMQDTAPDRKRDDDQKVAKVQIAVTGSPVIQMGPATQADVTLQSTGRGPVMLRVPAAILETGAVAQERGALQVQASDVNSYTDSYRAQRKNSLVIPMTNNSRVMVEDNKEVSDGFEIMLGTKLLDTAPYKGIRETFSDEYGAKQKEIVAFFERNIQPKIVESKGDFKTVEDFKIQLVSDSGKNTEIVDVLQDRKFVHKDSAALIKALDEAKAKLVMADAQDKRQGQGR